MAELDKSTQRYLNERLEGVLRELTIINGWPEIERYASIHGVWEALSKHKPWRTHLGSFDLFEILGKLATRTGLKAAPGERVKLSTALSPASFRQFVDDTRDYLLSLPRSYVVWIDLPEMPKWGPGELVLTRTMSIVESAISPREGVARAMGGLASILSETFKGPRLRIQAAGYGSGRLDNTAMADAISQVKQFFQLFRRLDVYVELTPALGGMLTGGRQLLRCELVDAAFSDEKMTVQLPEQLGRFLSSLSVDNSKLQILDTSGPRTLLGGRKMREAVTRDERVTALRSKVEWITQLMECPPEWPDAPRIRTALEWAFDSAEDNNQTLSFLQATIGLEALLGDDDKNEPLTTRLADRCAYLLGQTHKDREGIRKRFKDMYEVRSKLVHGRSPRLDLHDLRELSFAQSALGDVITEEANRLLNALHKSRQERS